MEKIKTDVVNEILKTSIYILIMVVLLSMTFFIGTLTTKELKESRTDYNYCSDNSVNVTNEDVIEMIDTVNKNCGSSFITEFCGKTKTESKYCVYTKEKKGEYEKTVYVPLEDCLN